MEYEPQAAVWKFQHWMTQNSHAAALALTLATACASLTVVETDLVCPRSDRTPQLRDECHDGTVAGERLDGELEALVHEEDEDGAETTRNVRKQAESRVLDGVEVDDVGLESSRDTAGGSARLAEKRIGDEVPNGVPQIHNGLGRAPRLARTDLPDWHTVGHLLTGTVLADEEVGETAHDDGAAEVTQENAVGLDDDAVGRAVVRDSVRDADRGAVEDDDESRADNVADVVELGTLVLVNDVVLLGAER